MLGFRLLVYLFDDRFEDSEYAIALAGNLCSEGTDSNDSAFAHLLLSHINDYRPVTNVADGKELHIITPAEFLGLLRSVHRFFR